MTIYDKNLKYNMKILKKFILLLLLIFCFSFSYYFEDSDYKVLVQYNSGLKNIYLMESCIIYIMLYQEIIAYFPGPISDFFYNYFSKNKNEIEELKNEFINFVREDYKKEFEYFNYTDKFQHYYDFYNILYCLYELIDNLITFQNIKKISRIDFDIDINNYDEYLKKTYLEVILILNFVININYRSTNKVDLLKSIINNIISALYNDLDLKRIADIINKYYLKYCSVYNLFSNSFFFDQKIKFKNIYFEFNLNFWQIKISTKLNQNLIIIKFPLIYLSEEDIIFIIAHELGHVASLNTNNDLVNEDKDYAKNDKIDFFYDFMGKISIIPKRLNFLNKLIRYDENIRLIKIDSFQLDFQSYDFNELIADLSANLFYKILFNRYPDYRSEFYLISLYEKEFFNYNDKYLKNPSLFFENNFNLLQDINIFNIYFFEKYLKLNNKYYLYQYYN